MQICLLAGLRTDQANMHAVRQWSAGGESPLAQGNGQIKDQKTSSTSSGSYTERWARVSKWLLKRAQGHTVKIGALDGDKSQNMYIQHIHIIFLYLICVLQISSYTYTSWKPCYCLGLLSLVLSRSMQAVLCVCECVWLFYTDHFVHPNCCFNGFLFWLYFCVGKASWLNHEVL